MQLHLRVIIFFYVKQIGWSVHALNENLLLRVKEGIESDDGWHMRFWPQMSCMRPV